MSRPELTAPPDVFYNDVEARKYTTNSRIQNIQRQITERALELLVLPQGEPSLILDVGCGSGLSGAVLEEHGHVWVGCDISADMLGIAASGESPLGDVFRRDMGQGLPFRPGTFDGAISISALQWLCYSDKNAHVPRHRLMRFFNSLYASLKPTARAALQFYPEKPEQAVLIAQCAQKAGFAGGLVVDYPNSAKRKKYYLCLSMQQGYRAPQGLSDRSAQGVQVGERASATKRSRKAKVAKKSKEWIQLKKERQRRQGKEVRHDSKFTGRKRKPRF
mmetsp:Transcript_19726/g.59738  ORF Transcript_19726/g.59738 Transcript_19726/m.59738 type:complete len:276 (-) Transcript_19726:39-866(-)